MSVNCEFNIHRFKFEDYTCRDIMYRCTLLWFVLIPYTSHFSGKKDTHAVFEKYCQKNKEHE